MINISYHRLFNLKISHNYYKNGSARGVQLMPTKATINLLKNGKMLLKKLQNQIVVLFQALNENPPVDPPNPFLPLDHDFRLTFALTVDNKSEFVNITNLDVSPLNQYRSGNILYFINNPANATDDPSNPENLNFSLLDNIRNSLFTYSFQLISVAPQVDLYIFPINDDGTLGTAIPVGKNVDGTDFPSPLSVAGDSNNPGNYSHSIDLRNKPSGRYRIRITQSGNPGNILKQEDTYIDDELASQNILGIVDLVYDEPTLTNATYKTTEAYNLQFSRKQSFWKYFLVKKSQAVNLASYTITDKGAVSPEVPYIVNTFAPIASPVTQINGLPVRVYQSNLPIDFFEKPKLKIELEGDAGNVKVENLPNASPINIIKKNELTDALESEIYVFL
jgi:hypothetical protein